MSLEIYTGYIPSLVTSNPTPTDPKSEGDDHLRGIKKTLADSFVGFTEPNIGVTVKASDINAVCAGGANSVMPVGMIAPMGMTTPPQGWIECDGRTRSRTTYAGLFAVIGETWGAGDGSTTFGIPDLGGQFPRGWQADQTVDPGRVFASNQASQNLGHIHTLSDTGLTTNEDGFHAHNVTAALIGASQPPNGIGTDPNPIGNSVLLTEQGGQHDHTIDGHTHIVASDGGFESRPVNVAVMYCIKY
jgi:microcystin-dependent protein